MSSRYNPLGGGSAAADLEPEPAIRMAAPVTGPEELEAIAEVLGSGILTNGPWTAAFEQAMASRHGTEHAVAVCNGTTALAAMLLAAGIGPGDEVVVPSMTFIGTATSVLHVGATPVFADIEPDTLNLDATTVESVLTAKTRAIIPVHYGGQPADMVHLKAIADDLGLHLLEDAAQAHGAECEGRPVGSWGDAAMFSFTPTKNITTGEGAIITTSDGELARRLRKLRNHGMSQLYQHDTLGYNWRLSELQSAVGVVQVGRLDSILSRKRTIVEVLRARLSSIGGIELLAERERRASSSMILTLCLPETWRPEVEAALSAKHIEHRVYFPPAHQQHIFSHPATSHLPVTESMAKRILSVPCHVELTNDDIDLIATTVESATTRAAHPL